MLSPFFINNQYGFDSASNTFQKPLLHWKGGVFYQRYPVRQKNGEKMLNILNPNLFRPLPLKIYRNELGGNNVGGSGAVASSSKIINILEQPAGFSFSKTDFTIKDNSLQQQTFINSKDIIDGNSTNTVDGKCHSFSSKFNNNIVVHSHTRDSQCLCKNTNENKTRCLTTSQSYNKEPYINIVNKSTCLSTQGNALTRVRNRGAYNCGGGTGNVKYHTQYTPTKNVDSLIVVINNY